MTDLVQGILLLLTVLSIGAVFWMYLDREFK